MPYNKPFVPARLPQHCLERSLCSSSTVNAPLRWSRLQGGVGDVWQFVKACPGCDEVELDKSMTVDVLSRHGVDPHRQSRQTQFTQARSPGHPTLGEQINWDSFALSRMQNVPIDLFSKSPGFTWLFSMYTNTQAVSSKSQLDQKPCSTWADASNSPKQDSIPRSNSILRPMVVMSSFLAQSSRIASEFELTAEDVRLGTAHFVRQLSTNMLVAGTGTRH